MPISECRLPNGNFERASPALGALPRAIAGHFSFLPTFPSSFGIRQSAFAKATADKSAFGIC
jgi:hypothetical protein